MERPKVNIRSKKLRLLKQLNDFPPPHLTSEPIWLELIYYLVRCTMFVSLYSREARGKNIPGKATGIS